MSKDTETKLQANNSYTSIIRSWGSSKTGCDKCDAKKLPICVCSKSGPEENESKEKSSAPTEKTKNINSMQQISHFSTPYFKSAEAQNNEESILLLSGPQHEFEFTLKPNVKLIDIKALLEQYIKELAHNDGVGVTRNDISIKELGKNLGIYYDDSPENTLAITMKHPEHFVEFSNRLRDKDLIVIKPDQAQKIENITPKENCQSFNPSSFSMALTPFKGI
jgi:hypothetical protein